MLAIDAEEAATRSLLMEKLVAAGLAHVAARITALARPAIRLERRRMVDAKIPIGGSKIGGRPDLRPGTAWPASELTRLSFVCQINLADIAKFACSDVLPRAGLLQFFCDENQPWGHDPSDKGSWVVRYEPSIAGLVRTMSGEYTPFRPCRLRFREVMTLPAWELYEFEQLGLSRGQLDAFHEVCEEFEEMYPPEEPLHQLLGTPDVVQGDMQRECQLVTNGIDCGGSSEHEDPRVAALEPGAKDWRLLLQLDSDEEECGMCWSLTGRVYLWMTEAALARHDWESAWLVLQY